MVGGFSSSIAKNIIAQRGARVEFIVIENESGQENFFYLAVTEKKYQELKDRYDKNLSIKPADYGFVIYQGVGGQPPEGLEKQIKDFFKNQ